MDVNFLVSLSSISLHPRLNCKYDTMKRHFACPHNPQFYICENATCVWIQLDKSSSSLSVFGRGMRLPTFLTKASDSKKLYDLIIFGLTFSRTRMKEDGGVRSSFCKIWPREFLITKDLDGKTLMKGPWGPWRDDLDERFSLRKCSVCYNSLLKPVLDKDRVMFYFDYYEMIYFKNILCFVQLDVF